jgi:POT family proton-dependent oligopeptide transporter
LSDASALPVQKGHPPGLYMLFFAEMWERFCFYGMRALLVLYLTKGFLGMSDEVGGNVYASYNALVYLTPIIGGIIADKVLGYRAAIILGGIIMALGEFTLVVEQEFAVYTGMALIICGNGLFKPNISSMVGNLYADGDPRRDAGFTIFYMGINIGALTSTLLCGWIGETYGYTYGFGLAGIGMLFGIITFGLGKARLQGQGEPPKPEEQSKRLGMVVLGIAVLVPCLYLLLKNQELVTYLLLAGLAITMGTILGVAFKSGKVQRERLFLLVVLWVFHALFWAFFEQAGTSLTLFTDRNVNCDIFGWTMPTSWGQFFNPAFIVIFGAVFSGLWIYLGRKDRDPSIPAKFGLALVQLGAGYGLLVFGASWGVGGVVPLIFLVMCYLLHTTGELCLSPVGLSAVTKLAPKKIVGMVMGAWFLSISAGHKIAGFVNAMAGSKPELANALKVFDALEDEKLDINSPEGSTFVTEQIVKLSDGNPEMQSKLTTLLASPAEEVTQQTLVTYLGVYNMLCWIAIGAGILLMLASPLLKKWQHGVK